MVAMGGGPEVPHREGEKSRELLLCVLPWPEKVPEKVIGEIKEEFPHLELHYIHEPHEKKPDRGKTVVPEGK